MYLYNIPSPNKKIHLLFPLENKKALNFWGGFVYLVLEMVFWGSCVCVYLILTSVTETIKLAFLHIKIGK